MSIFFLLGSVWALIFFCAIKNPLILGGGFDVPRGHKYLVGYVYPEGMNKESDDDLLSQARCLLSLARERFTVLFGMGRGGSTLLWSSDKGVRNELGAHPSIRIIWGADCLATFSRLNWKKVLLG